MRVRPWRSRMPATTWSMVLLEHSRAGDVHLLRRWYSLGYVARHTGKYPVARVSGRAVRPTPFVRGCIGEALAGAGESGDAPRAGYDDGDDAGGQQSAHQGRDSHGPKSHPAAVDLNCLPRQGQ